ncbi:hypothetical protein CWI75_15785 [Kineobactrum sediminis]|uniref:Uncharacterized protein n=1 Tax=Kineobactrum sediminis TaxID=1905677 RepID=A0A2N5XZF5_9GAMM|nr:hypothetical protein [Kineobactrum sediminis]PLW81479.1 hypothetical protein CWI75_15785 [Kineobactrum sediminis]
MKHCSRLVLLILTTCLLAACTVSSRQGSALLQAFQADDDALQAYRWQARLGGYSTNLLAVRHGGDTLFSNQQGDLLVFDGWTISRVVELGPLDREIDIHGHEGARIISSGARAVTHQCQPWQSQPLEDGGKRFIQDCEGREPYRNRIDINAGGGIVRVEQVINDRGQFIVLLGPNQAR